MNKQFYQFWSDVFSGMAQGQKHLEEISAWMDRGLPGAGDLGELFRRCYGLAPSGSESAQALRLWQNAIGDFQKVLGQFVLNK